MPSGQISTARIIAYNSFVQVMEHGASPDECLQSGYDENKSLKRVDRNFAKEILYGSLRWYSKIFWILQHTSKRDLKTSTPEIRAALICGTYQIFYMDRVPDRAAVNESAEYVRHSGQKAAVSFVNGILRQIARRAQYFAKPDKKTQQLEYLSLQFSHPEWIVKRWLKHFKFDRMESMLSDNNQPPPWFARINGLKTELTEGSTLQGSLLKNERTHTERRPLRSSLILKQAPDLGPESLFAQGYYTIQDESSQLIGYLVAPEKGHDIVDAAAGPGGKLTHVFELAGGEINLTGIERNENQFKRMEETVNRLGHKAINLVHKDFLEFKPEKPVDRVLLDAPCSGLGVLRRHPEGKWQKHESLIAEMAKLQRELLVHGISMVKPGGELIYSVCSFEPEESVEHLNWLQKEFNDKIELISPVSRVPDYYKKYVTRQNVLLVYSGNQDRMDGFGAFIIRVK